MGSHTQSAIKDQSYSTMDHHQQQEAPTSKRQSAKSVGHRRSESEALQTVLNNPFYSQFNEPIIPKASKL